MRSYGPACRLTILVGAGELFHHQPVYAEIVRRAHRAGLAGASVFGGVEGFGASGHVHTNRLVSLSDRRPLCVVIVDEEERIRDFLPQLDEVVGNGVVTVDPVQVYGPDGQVRPER